MPEQLSGSFEKIHECPNCGKPSLVQLGAGHYECMCCDFKRNLLHKAEGSKTENSSVPVLIILALLSFVVFLANGWDQNVPAPANAEPSPVASQSKDKDTFDPFTPVQPSAEFCDSNPYLASCTQSREF